MYRISSDLDLRDIVGSEVQQIRLGRSDVQFVFGSGTTICVQSRVRLVERGNTISEWDEEENWTSLDFQRLLMIEILRYAVPHDRLLEIHFAGELTLQLHDDSDQFETMQIYLGGSANGPIVV
jgi:hypothetical protein